MAIFIVFIILMLGAYYIQKISDSKLVNKRGDSFVNLIKDNGFNNFEKVLTDEKSRNLVSFDKKQQKVVCLIFNKKGNVEKQIDNFVVDNYSCVLEWEKGLFVAVDSNNEKLLCVKFTKSDIVTNIITFKSIISLEFKENDNIIFKKSTSSVIGKSILGGAIAGGFGALIGGSSASTSQKQTWKKSEIKLLLNEVSNPSYSIIWDIEFKSLPFITIIIDFKNKKSISLEEEAQKTCDFINVILDKIKNRNKENRNSNEDYIVADELIKLSKLKSEGILTDIEFQTQKEKLLNK